MANVALQKIGMVAFLAGIVIAILSGIWELSPAMTATLVILGVLVGVINVTTEETEKYLLAAVSLVIVTNFGGDYFGQIEVVGNVLQGILRAIQTFVTPATMIVALKTIYSLAGKA